MLRWYRLLVIAAVVLVAVALLAAGAILVFHEPLGDAARRLTVQRLEAATGRDASIGGRPCRTPRSRSTC